MVRFWGAWESLRSGRSASSVVYLIRHADAEGGQGSEAPLTKVGLMQANDLAGTLNELGIRRIVSSPYKRALQTVEPLARRLGLPIELDERLVERRVPFNPDVDWRSHIRRTFDDIDLVLPDVESSRSAQGRAVSAIREMARGKSPVVVATHGQLLALSLMHFDTSRGYKDWVAMTNPDVFRLTLGAETRATALERIWREV